MDNLWETRTQALKAIETELKREWDVIEGHFEIMDEMISIFHSQMEVSQFYIAAGLTLLKGRTMAKGILSLELDGLGQEAGALLRPLIECSELLEYFRLFPDGINQALNNKLPSPGKRAELIKGTLQGLRNHLNENASHLSLQPSSTKHLINFQTGDWKVNQPFDKTALRANMFSLFLMLSHLSYQAANCLVMYEFPTKLETRLNDAKREGLTTFSDLLVV